MYGVLVLVARRDWDVLYLSRYVLLVAVCLSIPPSIAVVPAAAKPETIDEAGGSRAVPASNPGPIAKRGRACHCQTKTVQLRHYSDVVQAPCDEYSSSRRTRQSADTIKLRLVT